jgi:hypothetical protein
MVTSIRLTYLTYRVRGRDDAWQGIDEVIERTATPCPCGRRVAILYGAGVYFRCRHCYDLRYQTERETPPFRQLTKAQKIRERLGGQGNLREAFPPKPPKMRWDTYWRLECDVHDAEITGLSLALAQYDQLRRRK